jgi:hypothetical protein
MTIRNMYRYTAQIMRSKIIVRDNRWGLVERWRMLEVVHLMRLPGTGTYLLFEQRNLLANM